MWLAEKPSLRAASCCSVEVVNGGGGFFDSGLVSTETTVNRPSSTTFFAASALPLSPIDSRSSFLPSSATSRAVNGVPSASKLAETCQYSCALEELDLALAVDDQAQRDRLDPAGRLGARQLAPQDRRQGEADQIIERAARPVGVDQILIEPARMRHRLGHRRLGDGVEGDALDLGRQRLALPQHFLDVPADRLALTIGVGREDQRVGLLRRVGDRLQLLGLVGIGFPLHREARVRIDRAVLGRQVADMAIAGQHACGPGPDIFRWSSPWRAIQRRRASTLTHSLRTYARLSGGGFRRRQAPSRLTLFPAWRSSRPARSSSSRTSCTAPARRPTGGRSRRPEPATGRAVPRSATRMSGSASIGG